MTTFFNHKKIYRSKIVITIVYFSLLYLSAKIFFDTYSLKLHEANFSAFEYMLYYISGSDLIYVIILLVLLPIQLNHGSILISTSNADKFQIQRLGYPKFYKKHIKESFINGFIFGVLMNLMLMTYFIVLSDFNRSSMNTESFNISFIFIKNPNITLILFFGTIAQSVGIGLINILIFLITRIKLNKYVYYLSLLFFATISTTGIAAILGLLSNYFPSLYAISTPLQILLTIVNPFSLLFPFQVTFSNYLSYDLRFFITCVSYILILKVLKNKVQSQEEKYA